LGGAFMGGLDACVPSPARPCTGLFGISRESLDKHAADAAAASSHNAGTVRIHPPGRDRNLGHRRTALHAIRACPQVLRVSGRPGPARLIASVHRLDHRHCKPPNTYDHGMNRPGESGDPSHRSCAEACPLPARIALSYLMDWPQRSRPQDRLPGDARLQAPTGDGQRADAVTSPFIGLAVVTRLETCCSPSGLPVSGAAPYGYSQPGTGCLATPCECGCEASALAGTHIA
jgi:hypothetical protein